MNHLKLEPAILLKIEKGSNWSNFSLCLLSQYKIHTMRTWCPPDLRCLQTECLSDLFSSPQESMTIVKWGRWLIDKVVSPKLWHFVWLAVNLSANWQIPNPFILLWNAKEVSQCHVENHSSPVLCVKGLIHGDPTCILSLQIQIMIVLKLGVLRCSVCRWLKKSKIRHFDAWLKFPWYSFYIK